MDFVKLYNTIADNTKIYAFLTKNELVASGFQCVDTHQVNIDGLNYLCCRRRIVPITKQSEFDYDKNKIIQIIKEHGFTHIKKVELSEFTYYFDTNSLKAEPAITMMIESFTKKD